MRGFDNDGLRGAGEGGPAFAKRLRRGLRCATIKKISN